MPIHNTNTVEVKPNHSICVDTEINSTDSAAEIAITSHDNSFKIIKMNLHELAANRLQLHPICIRALIELCHSCRTHLA